MAITVSGKNYTQISGCESITDGGDWTGVDTQDNKNFKEGSYSLCGTLKANGDNDAVFTPTVAVDMSGTKHLRFWYICTSGGLLNTFAGGGIQVGISDGINTGFWKLAGRDTYEGGWINLVVDVSSGVDSGTKPTNMNAITEITIRNNQTLGKNVDNVWIDNLCLCDGIIAYGDDAGGYFDFDAIFNVDDDPAVGGWGIIRRIGGQYFLTGSVEFGDASGSSGTKFQAKAQVVVFENRKVNSGLYGFTVVDNGTGTTEFILGDKAGTAGIEGCVIRVADITQTPKYKVDGGTDTDVDNFKLYGSTFLDASTLKFPDDAVNVEVLNCSFESCDEVLATTCVIKNCNFVSANDEAFVLPSGNTHKLEYCNFINNPDAWRIPNAGSYTCKGCKFINNTNDIDNTSGGPVTINKTNLADPTTHTGDTTIQGAVDLTITVVDSTNTPIENAQCAIFKTSDDTQLMNEDTLATGVATEVYTGSTPIDIYVRIRKSSTGATKYVPASTTGTVTSGGFSAKITLAEDPNA